MDWPAGDPDFTSVSATSSKQSWLFSHLHQGERNILIKYVKIINKQIDKDIIIKVNISLVLKLLYLKVFYKTIPQYFLWVPYTGIKINSSCIFMAEKSAFQIFS